MKNGPIILFDGVCNLCNAAVNFIIKRDRKAVFRFASLQSSVGKTLLREFNVPSVGGSVRGSAADAGGDRIGDSGDASDSYSTFFLVDNGRYYTQSTAALKVLAKLGMPWSLLYGFIILPKPFRDGAYRVIARYRYRWFGRTEQCMIPTPDVKDRFLSWD